MENKYFTPDIEDIRVGYEFEQYIPGSEKKDGIKKYNKRKVGDLHSIIGTAYNAGLQDWIRVPYLTKEQIRAEGWKETKSVSGALSMGTTEFDTFLPLVKGGWCLHYIPSKYLVRIAWFAGIYPLNIVYQGECKDINTFRYICKLLGI